MDYVQDTGPPPPFFLFPIMVSTNCCNRPLSTRVWRYTEQGIGSLTVLRAERDWNQSHLSSRPWPRSSTHRFCRCSCSIDRRLVPPSPLYPSILSTLHFEGYIFRNNIFIYLFRLGRSKQISLQPRLYLPSSCLSNLSPGIRGMHHHAQLTYSIFALFVVLYFLSAFWVYHSSLSYVSRFLINPLIIMCSSHEWGKFFFFK